MIEIDSRTAKAFESAAEQANVTFHQHVSDCK